MITSATPQGAPGSGRPVATAVPTTDGAFPPLRLPNGAPALTEADARLDALVDARFREQVARSPVLGTYARHPRPGRATGRPQSRGEARRDRGGAPVRVGRGGARPGGTLRAVPVRARARAHCGPARRSSTTRSIGSGSAARRQATRSATGCSSSLPATSRRSATGWPRSPGGWKTPLVSFGRRATGWAIDLSDSGTRWNSNRPRRCHRSSTRSWRRPRPSGGTRPRSTGAWRRRARAAESALEEYAGWLQGRLEDATDDFALGPERLRRHSSGCGPSTACRRTTSTRSGSQQLAANREGRRAAAREVDAERHRGEVLARIKQNHPTTFEEALDGYRNAMLRARDVHRRARPRRRCPPTRPCR